MAACVVLLTLFLAAAVVVRTAAGASSTLDFSAFYTAGHLVSEGLGNHLYDIEFQESVQRGLSGDNYDQPLPFAAPAFVAIIFAPLAALPLQGAFGVMLLVNIAALACVLAMLRRAMTDVPSPLRTLVLGVTALAIPTISVLTAGQIDLVVTAALLGGLLLLRADRPIAAGLVLALAFAKPQLTIGVLLLLVATRDWRPLVTMLAAGIVLALAPVAALGTHALAGNIEALDAVGRPVLMANWRGFLASAGAPDDVWIWGPGWVTIVGAALILAWRAWQRQGATTEQKWALAFLLPLLVSPHLHGQSLVLALPAVALFLQSEAHIAAQASPIERHAWETRATRSVLLLFVALFVRWALTLAGLSLSIFLLAAVFVAFALPYRQLLAERRSRSRVPRASSVDMILSRPYGTAFQPS